MSHNTCVCCGAYVPEGTQFCMNCWHNNTRCPECKGNLTYKGTVQAIGKDFLNTTLSLYHCPSCDVDWQAPIDDLSKFKLHRKFWG